MNKFDQTMKVETVPKNLKSDQKFSRKRVCSEIAKKNYEDANILNALVACDKIRLFQYDPETKDQSTEGQTPGSPRPKRV
jgi:hypothetical protein